jgi:hypothetical protein
VNGKDSVRGTYECQAKIGRTLAVSRSVMSTNLMVERSNDLFLTLRLFAHRESAEMDV